MSVPAILNALAESAHNEARGRCIDWLTGRSRQPGDEAQLIRECLEALNLLDEKDAEIAKLKREVEDLEDELCEAREHADLLEDE